MTDDTFYCPCCDTPLKVTEYEPGIDYETYFISVECPLCRYERSAVEPTLCECWSIIEADMERARRIG